MCLHGSSARRSAEGNLSATLISFEAGEAATTGEKKMVIALWLIVSTSHGVTTSKVAELSSMNACTDSAKATQFVAAKSDGNDQTITFVCIRTK
jgi:hypothetical protein